MNQRLLQFLSAENISQAQFADTIGVARASVSHILAGRNKPGFDFIESMSSHFPDLSLEWLINGKGKMYKSMAVAAASEPQVILPSSALRPSEPEKTENRPVEAERAVQQSSAPSLRPTPRQGPEIPRVQDSFSAGGKVLSLPHSDAELPARHNISRIIVFYDDNTYQELK